MAPDVAQCLVDILERIGGVFDIRTVQIQQYIEAIGDVILLDRRTTTLQPEHGQVFLADREQDALVHDKRDRDATRKPFAIKQEIRVQVDIVVVLDVKPRGHLEVTGLGLIRQVKAIVFADDGPLGLGRIEQIDPDGIQPLQGIAKRQLLFAQPPFDQLERDDLAFGFRMDFVCHQLLSHAFGQFAQEFLPAAGGHCQPEGASSLCRHRHQCRRDILDGCVCQQSAELCLVLALKHRLDELVARHFLPMHERFDDFLLVEDFEDLFPGHANTLGWISRYIGKADDGHDRKAT